MNDAAQVRIIVERLHVLFRRMGLDWELTATDRTTGEQWVANAHGTEFRQPATRVHARVVK